MIVNIDMDVVYKRIKLLVRERGMSLIQLAEETGLSINTIKNWGRGTEASLSNLLTIACYVDVSLDYLVGNSDNPESHKSNSDWKIEAWEEIKSIAEKKISEAQVPSEEEEKPE